MELVKNLRNCNIISRLSAWQIYPFQMVYYSILSARTLPAEQTSKGYPLTRARVRGKIVLVLH